MTNYDKTKRKKYPALRRLTYGRALLSTRITFQPEDEEVVAFLESAPQGKVAAAVRELVRAGFRARWKQEAKRD